MIHVHPFPARMAPEIALKGMKNLPEEYLVLDPMSGSGMVLGTAAKLGLHAVGYDLDPLACLISKANGTAVDATNSRNACQELLILSESIAPATIALPWVDEETQRYMEFWFGPKQRDQLIVLSHLLVAKPFIKNPKIIDILKVAVSRLIITKDPKASFARDTAHSRPHRTITENEFDIFAALPKSLEHVLKALQPKSIKRAVKSYRGDARRMGRIRDESVDCILTSPPYLNAIDYMRGHRLSLVWLGYSVGELRKIRSRSVGAEVVEKGHVGKEMLDFISLLHSDVSHNKRRMLMKYYQDLCGITAEAYRVLKPKRTAIYVVGNSNIKGHEIKNSDLLIMAAKQAGFSVCNKVVREIPENRRYMPLVNSGTSSLSKRMRSEHVITLEKG